jgi:hypothetical protein
MYERGVVLLVRHARRRRRRPAARYFIYLLRSAVVAAPPMHAVHRDSRGTCTRIPSALLPGPVFQAARSVCAHYGVYSHSPAGCCSGPVHSHATSVKQAHPKRYVPTKLRAFQHFPATTAIYMEYFMLAIFLVLKRY